ncbi:MAG: FAD-dependent oxidoreductase, partial [Desulfobacteraceae bacterium]|nr:FAD-dependent oxidoreductase [Desulfobacteraceae bacterium]
MRFVIIGGDAAGMSAASRAKRNSPELTVTVLEQTEDVSYSACGMPYNIAEAGRAMDDLVVRQAHVFREKQGIDLRTGHSVEEIDRNSNRVRGMNSAGEPFEISYDRLLIATGASPVKPDLPGVDTPGVMALKSLEDGRRIKDFIEKESVRKVIIIGMGYIALEVCEALVARGIDVEMVKPRPTLLPWMNSSLAGVIKEEIESHGVLIHPGQEIQSIARDQDKLKVTISIGIAQFQSGVDTWETLLKRADVAMYKSKNGGRDRWSVAE